MRILFALTAFALACGSGPKKKDSSMVSGDTEGTPTCCCKTLPTTAEKEIVPNYAQAGRMECSSQHGDCVDDVQCTNSPPADGQPATRTDGVPPPPVLEPSTTPGM